MCRYSTMMSSETPRVTATEMRPSSPSRLRLCRVEYSPQAMKMTTQAGIRRTDKQREVSKRHPLRERLGLDQSKLVGQ